MPKRLKELLAGDKVVNVFCLGQFLSPKYVELVAMSGGFDAVWFDHEHAGVAISQIETGALAARAHGLDSFVRLAPTDYASVMRPLEAGAGGIMAAQVRSADEVERVMQWAKFHPRGLRGVNGSGVDGRFGATPPKEYFTQANRDSFVAIQIEHVDALEDVERIAHVPDVDLLFVGPADLGQSMGIPGEWNHPRLWEAIERVARVCRQQGKPWAIVPLDAAYARRCVDLGCKCLSMAFDNLVIHLGLKAVKQLYPAYF